jgi:hypothetical protein
MRTTLVALALAVAPALLAGGCDSKEEPDLGLPQTKSLGDLKKSSRNEMSKEELEEARRKAGFKDDDELRAEAKAAYEASEKSFVKGRTDRYKALFAELRTRLDEVEKQAPKWAKAKDPDKAFGKWSEKYKEGVKTLLDEYDALTEKGSRGGDLQVDLAKVIADWENLNGDLGPKIADAEGFATTLETLRSGLDAIEKIVDDIDKDDTIEPEDAPEDGKADEKKDK